MKKAFILIYCLVVFLPGCMNYLEYSFLSSYVDTLEADHDADVTYIDFMNNYEEARDRINQWAGNATEEKIPELIPDPWNLLQTVRSCMLSTTVKQMLCCSWVAYWCRNKSNRKRVIKAQALFCQNISSESINIVKGQNKINFCNLSCLRTNV